MRRCQRELSQTQSYCLIDTVLPTDAIVYVLSCAYGLHGWLRPLTWGGQFAFALLGLVWLDSAWFGYVWSGSFELGLVLLGLVCLCLAWSVPTVVWPDLAWLFSEGFGLVPSGSGLSLLGLSRLSLVLAWSCLVWSVLV